MCCCFNEIRYANYKYRADKCLFLLLVFLVFLQKIILEDFYSCLYVHHISLTLTLTSLISLPSHHSPPLPSLPSPIHLLSPPLSFPLSSPFSPPLTSPLSHPSLLPSLPFLSPSPLPSGPCPPGSWTCGSRITEEGCQKVRTHGHTHTIIVNTVCLHSSFLLNTSSSILSDYHLLSNNYLLSIVYQHIIFILKGSKTN